MPIEIKELHIRVTVNAPDATQAGNTQASLTAGSPPASNAGHEVIVAECVEQVMDILRRKGER